MFNLHELAPDPIVRKRFGMLLDLALIEEAQISVHGRRGGGRSRADGSSNSFEAYKNLLYAPDGRPAKGSHSNVIETSRYQAPAAAIFLRKRAFPSSDSFLIRNRVLGEEDSVRPEDGKTHRFAADSALVNIAWRTPHYLLGSTLQNPSLILPGAKKTGWKYGGISRQKRWCGMLFDDATSEKVSSVYPVIEQTRGGRPQHAYWSVQHQHVILLQRIAPETRNRMGSYSTGAIGIRFDGDELEKLEVNDWIFASNGRAYVGVKFLDSGYQWNENHNEVTPADFDHQTDTSRILMHAGDITTDRSFERFQQQVLSSPLTVNAKNVTYTFSPSGTRLTTALFDAEDPKSFTLPTVNGTPIDLRPATTWQSPFLNGKFGSDKISVTVGPINYLLDFIK